MDRHKAYEVLSEQLLAYREKTHAELAAQLDVDQSERVGVEDDEELLLLTRVSWHDEEKGASEVAISADTPSTWKLERLEERLIVRPAWG